MRNKITFVIFLNVIFTCHGLFEKLLDPLNIGGKIIERINKIGDHHTSMRDGKYGGYSSNGYGGSSSSSFSYGGSLNGNAGQSQSYGYGSQSQTFGQGIPSQNYGYINQQTQPQPTTVYVITSQDGHPAPPQEVIYGQQEGDTGGFQTGVSHNGHLSFNINLGGLFGLGHEHHHHHGHEHQNFNTNNQYPQPQFNPNIAQRPSQIEEYEVTIISNKPEHGGDGYQNQNNHQIVTNIPEQVNDHYQPGYNNNGGNTYQSDDKYQHSSNHNTGNNYQSNTNYNRDQNQNPGGAYDKPPVINPVQDERNGGPDQGSTKCEEQDISTELVTSPTPFTYFTSTETTKTPYEKEKDTKVTTSNRKTTVRPDKDEPLLIPLNPNEYTYEGDKIQFSAPKRNAEGTSSTTKKPETTTKEEEYDLDERFGKEE